MFYKKIILFFFFFLCTNLLVGEEYAVQFFGLTSDTKTLDLLRSSSQLLSLQNSPPATRIGLQKRTENDIKNFIKVLHSQAYYNARIESEFDYITVPIQIKINIDSGPVYPVTSFEIFPSPQSKGSFPYSSVSAGQLGLIKGQPATTKAIFDAEKELEQMMDCAGYPYARVTNKVVIADQEEKTITVTFFIDSGSKYIFGITKVTGSKKVRRSYFNKHIAWNQGEVYSPLKIRKTQNELELGGLFSSVSLSLPESAPESEEIPVTIQVKENKPRTIGLGINYETERGIGASQSWTHRNFTGKADNLGFRGAVWSDKHYGELSYIQPDFRRKHQDLIWSADYLRERDEGYTSKSYSISGILGRQVNPSLLYSYGIMYKHLIDTDIHESTNHQSQKHDNDTFNLFKTPINFYLNKSNSILDPTEGYRLKIKSIPSYNFIGSQIFYSINILGASYYLPLDSCNRHLFAFQATLGLIPGPCKTKIPRSELFDAGTDSLLRGYRYKTVSPLDNEYKPTGGRSMMIYTLEYRMRMNKEIGWVLFYDFGNVYESRTPQFNRKILQSTGVGLRYFTPVGPIRLDLAFPLNPRKHVEKSRYQAYLSIGQTF